SRPSLLVSRAHSASLLSDQAASLRGSVGVLSWTFMRIQPGAYSREAAVMSARALSTTAEVAVLTASPTASVTGLRLVTSGGAVSGPAARAPGAPATSPRPAARITIPEHRRISTIPPPRDG